MGRRTRRRRHRNVKPKSRIIDASKASDSGSAPQHLNPQIPVTPKQQEQPTRVVAVKRFDVKNLQSVNRIITLPIVETGWNYAENVYNKVKRSNNLVYWTFQQAESTIQTAVDTALPVVGLFQTPISTIDRIVCKSLDIVEDTFPSIQLPPEIMYWNTKKYVSDVGAKIVRPVLKRADSVKQIGNTVLTNKYTTFAANTLDGALDVADKYVDKYLPPEVYDDQIVDDRIQNNSDGPAGKAIHHVGRFSGKLQRRLTKRTLIEAKALKEQSAEAIHVLIYVAELIATDPKLAYQKGKELWGSLSKDEPENQARPENLEQLIVLLTRESARRLVHFTNFTVGLLSQTRRTIANSFVLFTSTIIHIADSLVKSVHLEGVQQAVIAGVKIQAKNFVSLLKQVNIYLSDILDQVQHSLVVSEQPKNALTVPPLRVEYKAVRRTKENTNGVETNS